jgi:hypothetical protein
MVASTIFVSRVFVGQFKVLEEIAVKQVLTE